MLTVGSLFSGIGGLDLGFERAGFDIRWQVERDEYCRQVLARHWPDVRRFRDVRRVSGRPQSGRWCRLEPVDVIAGGFPCQDISFAGSGEGLSGKRSGLWRQFLRLMGELRPRYGLVENVAALLHRGIDTICGDLAGIGYDAEWSVVSACSMGTPHVRRRLFLVAYTHGVDGRPRVRDSLAQTLRSLQSLDGFTRARAGYRERLADPSALYRNADGVPHRLERNRAIGNSVHPAIAQWIAEGIQAIEGVERADARGLSDGV